MKPKLYKVEFHGEANKSLTPRIEYIRCKSLKMLTHAMTTACKAPHSQYYGYTSFDIEPAKGFPEIMSITIPAKTMSRKKK